MRNLFILLILVLSCSTNKSNEIPLFNNIVFVIHDGEAIGDIHSEITNIYTEYFNNKTIQVPLFKYIKHKDYKIFLGIPYNTSIKQLISSQLENKDSSLINFKSDSLFFFNKYLKNGIYITEYALVIEKEALFYISTMTNTIELSDSLFNVSELSKRIKYSIK